MHSATTKPLPATSSLGAAALRQFPAPVCSLTGQPGPSGTLKGWLHEAPHASYTCPYSWGGVHHEQKPRVLLCTATQPCVHLHAAAPTPDPRREGWGERCKQKALAESPSLYPAGSPVRSHPRHPGGHSWKLEPKGHTDRETRTEVSRGSCDGHSCTESQGTHMF